MLSRFPRYDKSQSLGRTNVDERTDQSLFDPLVHGELRQDEHKSLLVSLDDEPGAWRRCAMAFLESQALAADLGAIRESSTLSAPTIATVDNTKATSNPWNRAAALLAIAASFLVAFCLGIAA